MDELQTLIDDIRHRNARAAALGSVLYVDLADEVEKARNHLVRLNNRVRNNLQRAEQAALASL